ncbi:MAG: thioesterase [Lachnospiraceae bacterium]|nr:thioesterase [Lachnospiraceae bacterium]
MDTKYEFSGKVRYSEVDETGRLSLNALVNYFQDVSTFQSEHLGIGLDYLKEHRVAWILSSWQIVVNRYPKLCETVKAQTWPYEFKGFYGMRNFTLLGEEDEMLAKANSVWVLYDQESSRPVRVFPEIIEAFQFGDKMDMEYAPRKITLPKNGEERECFLITKNHLDTNHHVNNGQYIAMAAEYLPENFFIRQMRAEYRLQAHLHDEVFPIIYREGKKVTVELGNAEGKAYAAVEFME